MNGVAKRIQRLLVMRVWSQMRKSPWPKAIRMRVTPVAVGVTAAAALTIGRGAIRDLPALAILGGATVLLLRTSVPTPIVLGAAALAGAAIEVRAEMMATPTWAESVQTQGPATVDRAPVERKVKASGLEFAVRSVIKAVPAPAGTGLPNIQSITLDRSIVPMQVHLLVKDVENPAWEELPDEEKLAYARAVAAALAERFPEVEGAHRWDSAFYIVRVYDSFLVAKSARQLDPAEPFRCTTADPWEGVSECRGISASAIVEIPVRR